ncbi:DUF1648 domain-containing protein [Candidatus Latescibacterota bacterium]
MQPGLSKKFQNNLTRKVEIMDKPSKFPHPPFIKILNGMAVLSMFVSLPLPFLFWSELPDSIPHHFDISGRPDSWGGKGIIFVMPVVNFLITTLLFSFRVPGKNARQYYHAQLSLSFFRLWVAGFCTYIEWMMIQIALGNAQDLGKWFSPIFLGVIVVILGYASVALYVTDNSNDWN